MPESSSFCPVCGRRVGGAGIASRERLLAGLAYMLLVPAVVLLLTEPFNRNPYVRYHSLQSIFYWAVALVVAIALRLLALVLILIPTAGLLMVVLLSVVAAVGWLLGLFVLAIKAWQGLLFPLPFVGARTAAWATRSR